MISTRIRYASSLLSKNASNVYLYRPVAQRKLRSRFITSKSYLNSPGFFKACHKVFIIGLGMSIGIGWTMHKSILDTLNVAKKAVVDTTKAAVQNAKAHVEETKDEIKRVADTTKAAVQNAKAYVKETKDEVKEIFEDTRVNPREKAARLVDLAKEKRAKWQARKNKGRDDNPPQSEDETS